jgi:hypothetical protein
MENSSIVLCGGCQPALLMRQSMRPKRSTAASTTCRMSSGLLTSARTNTASPGPFRFTSASNALPSFSLREQNTTFEAPSSTNTFTQPAPIPLLPPVTMVTLSL